MKRILTVMIIYILCFSMLSIFTPRGWATDGSTGFEDGFDGWTSTTQYGATVQRSTVQAHSGIYSVEQNCHSTGSDPLSSVASIRYPTTATLPQYELIAWVYVAERSDADASSTFGFLYGSEVIGWAPWGDQSSYAYVRLSEGYTTKGDPYNPIPYGLSKNVWHQVKVIISISSGTESIWLDGTLVLDQWPASNPGEKPDHYYIDAGANYYGSYVMHQYIDDVQTSSIPPVGGHWIPVNRLEILAPTISLASLATIATASIIYAKHKKKKQN